MVLLRIKKSNSSPPSCSLKLYRGQFFHQLFNLALKYHMNAFSITYWLTLGLHHPDEDTFFHTFIGFRASSLDEDTFSRSLSILGSHHSNDDTCIRSFIEFGSHHPDEDTCSRS
ncbi:hypothetical protein, partial [Peribacillus cavernae]